MNSYDKLMQEYKVGKVCSLCEKEFIQESGYPVICQPCFIKEEDMREEFYLSKYSLLKKDTK